MNNSQRLTHRLLHCALAAACFTPALGWAHGAVDIPESRQVHCYTIPDLWQTPSSINDAGCRAAILKSGVYPMQQWHEVTKLVTAPDYNDDAKIRAAIPDGQLCGAADPRKDGLNLPSPDWYKTTVTPKDGTVDVRINATAPHVPSFVKIYLSKAGFNPATTPLKWSDLELIHEETNTVARRDWGNKPPKPWGSGFFLYKVGIPSGRSGSAILFTRWQRIDPAGEGFYSCSDIVINSTGALFPWFDKGSYLPTDITPVAGDTIRFRVLGHTPDAREVIDERLPITATNQPPTVWGKQLADKLLEYGAIIRLGNRVDNAIVFDPVIANNQIFLANELDTPALSITSGGGPVTPPPVDPRPPQAIIQGPATVISGESFTLSGKASTGYNGSLAFHWTVPWSTGDVITDTTQQVAPTVTAPTQYSIQLRVFDAQNQASGIAQTSISVTPKTISEYPPYVPGGSYTAGQVVTNNGKNYRCKPFPYSGWCSQAPAYYAPGTGSHWGDAWDEN
ncbi:lytic polysaccharide monooxygenase [uncultured Pseudomonas sp.]|uniref:lytic polysaccharide monooxygenase n=1 Tax=uncultured Pseudomonas sp. TaxID=114707 RepID=UPI0025D5C7BF|nr:lytic polysaccharide monooxygenase [uncultured Pseudomonas sp.]